MPDVAKIRRPWTPWLCTHVPTCVRAHARTYSHRERGHGDESAGEGNAGHAGYHDETRVSGVPLAGYVLRPGRAINCELLSLSLYGQRGTKPRRAEGGKMSGERRGTLHCYRFTRHAYLTPAFFAHTHTYTHITSLSSYLSLFLPPSPVDGIHGRIDVRPAPDSFR